MAIELDGKHWHTQPDQIERDRAKENAAKRDGIRLVRVPSHKIYRYGHKITSGLVTLQKNHSGELGIAWAKIFRLRKGTVTRPDHAYAKKYDICLDADEHSFCCETIFIHNSRYKSIPFGHDKSESQVPSALRSLEQTLKTELKKRKIPFKKIEKNADGSPKLGKLHELNIDSDQKGPTGIPYLQGVNIYQSQSEETGEVSRSIMTFRTVSDKHKALGRWFHPGLDPKHFFEMAFAWSQQVWENEILPEILKS